MRRAALHLHRPYLSTGAKEARHVDRILDAGAFYDGLASFYRELSERRATYLAAIDDIILQRVRSNAVSMLDLGCADGRRALNIARRLGITEFVLVDQSAEMVRAARRLTPLAEVVQADITQPDLLAGRRFDVVTCLWNVLGHVGAVLASAALRNVAELLAPGGQAFVDVNNRYNARHYGSGVVARNIVADAFGAFRGTNVVINIEGRTFATHSYVFAPWECRRMFDAAGLDVVRRWCVDYNSGAVARTPWSGQLAYELVGSGGNG